MCSDLNLKVLAVFLNLPRSYGLNLVLLISYIFVAIGCHKSPNTSGLKIGTDYLLLSGKLQSADSRAVGEVAVDAGPLGRLTLPLDSTGQFSLPIMDEQLVLLRSLYSPRTPDFQISFQTLEEQNSLAAVSPVIDLNSSGQISLGNISLSAQGRFQGSVSLYQVGGIHVPANGAIVRFGAAAAQSGPDGSFVMESLPSGQFYMTVDFPGYETGFMKVHMTTDGNVISESPVVLIPNSMVAGEVINFHNLNQSETHDQNSPFRRLLSVFAGRQVQLIRYHHDLETFNSMAGEAAWRPIRSNFFYDFSGPGLHKLYYQFKGSGGNSSEIFTANVLVDLFNQEGTGIVINDGSGVISALGIEVATSFPTIAAFMRMSSTLSDLDPNNVALPWRQVMLATQLQLSTETKANQFIELYAQYKTQDGTIGS